MLHQLEAILIRNFIQPPWEWDCIKMVPRISKIYETGVTPEGNPKIYNPSALMLRLVVG